MSLNPKARLWEKRKAKTPYLKARLWGGTESQNTIENDLASPITSVWTREKLQETYPDHTVLTWVTCDMAGAAMSVSDEVIEAVNEYLVRQGADFVLCFETYAESQYEVALNNRIAENDAPDLICGGLCQLEYGVVRELRNGWLLELDEYLKTPDGRALWEAFPENYWKTMKYEGHYYGVTSVVDNTDQAYFVNKSMMEQYGITAQMLADCSLSELGDILQKVKDGEGEKCRLLALSNSIYDMEGYMPITEKNDISSDALVLPLGEDSARAVNLFEEPEAAEWFKTLGEFYLSGYMQEAEKCFIYVMQTSRLRNQAGWKEILQAYFGSEDNIEIVYFGPGALYPKGTLTGVCASSRHQEQALQALTLAMTDPVITDLMLYGTEEEDYKNPEGFVTKENYDILNAMQYGNLFIRSFQEYEKNLPQNYRFDVVNEAYVTPQAGMMFDLEAYSDQISQIQTIVGDYRGLFSGTIQDVDGALEELNKRLHEAGIDEVLRELNRQLANAEILGGAK